MTFFTSSHFLSPSCFFLLLKTFIAHQKEKIQEREVNKIITPAGKKLINEVINTPAISKQTIKPKQIGVTPIRTRKVEIVKEDIIDPEEAFNQYKQEADDYNTSLKKILIEKISNDLKDKQNQKLKAESELKHLNNQYPLNDDAILEKEQNIGILTTEIDRLMILMPK